MQRGKPLARKTPLARGTGPQRRTRLRPVNSARKRKEYARQFGDLAAYVRGLPCCACGRHGPSDPHHVRNRRMWGAWLDLDGDRVGNLAPLCRECHRRHHDGHALGLDLAEVAACCGRAYMADTGGDAC